MTSSDETLPILPQAQEPSNKYLQWARSHYPLIQAYRGALEDVDRLNFLRGRPVPGGDDGRISGAEVGDPVTEAAIRSAVVDAGTAPSSDVESGGDTPSSLTRTSEAEPGSGPERANAPQRQSGWHSTLLVRYQERGMLASAL